MSASAEVTVLAHPCADLLEACAANFLRRVQEERTAQWQKMIDAGGREWSPFVAVSWEDCDVVSKEAYLKDARWYLEGAAIYFTSHTKEAS